MIYAIASYHRPKCRTVKALLDADVPKENIVISLQDESEIEEYKKYHDDIKIIYRKGSCLSENRNTILDEIPERPICLLDDDITSFCYYDKKNSKFITDTKKSLSMIDDLTKISIENNCEFFGISANANAIITANRPEISIDILCQGTVLIMLSDSLRYDVKQKMVQDYEICLRTIYQGKHLLRGNYIAANKPQNGTNEGGLHDEYKRKENLYWHKVLAKKYPIYKINKKGNGGTIQWK